MERLCSVTYLYLKTKSIVKKTSLRRQYASEIKKKKLIYNILLVILILILIIVFHLAERCFLRREAKP